MIGTVFYFILNMSLASCFVIVALLLIRQIRPLPRRVIYPLWILAFVRLMIPFALPTSGSLFNFTGGLVKQLITVETITHGVVSIPDAERLSIMNTIGVAEQYVPIAYKTESMRQVFTTISVIWATTALVALLAALFLYLMTRKELKKAVLIKDNLFHSDVLHSPVLAGLIRPRIILPDFLDPDSAEARMILAHEDVHRRRLDNLWRLLGICVTCLHWFNPFAWIMLRTFFTDMELSCDEAVIRKYGTEERKAYAETLLRFAENKRTFARAAFGRSGVKMRIINVLHYKKLTLMGALTSSLFLLAVTVVLITNPQL